MATTPRIYRATDSPIMLEYHDFVTQFPEPTGAKLFKQMKEFVKQDPYFLDPYLILAEECTKKKDFRNAARFMNEAYTRALKLILDKSGNWPDSLEWRLQENRHIIRTFLNRAVQLWQDSFLVESLDLSRKILKADPEDRTGMRFQILAIRMDKSFEEYDLEFNWPENAGLPILKWFEKNYMKYPEEFMDYEWFGPE